jgi:hypothetical protein
MIYVQTNSYNLEVAKVFGVCTAIFLGCINEEFEYQLRHKSVSANNAISITRAEIYERTGLEDTKQVEIELALTECGILITKPVKNVPNKNYYTLNDAQFIKIMNSVNPSEVIGEEKAKQFTKQPRVEPINKRQTYIIQLKKKINVSDPVIQQYLVDWIDAVYAKPKGFLSPTGVTIAQQELLAYTKDSQEKQIAILKIAIKDGLRDLTWAIERYEKQSGLDSSRNFASYEDIKANAEDCSEEVY